MSTIPLKTISPLMELPRVEVPHSIRWCRDVCCGSGSSFVSSFRLLDTSRRHAMYALYAFARLTDDLGDGARDTPACETLGDRAQMLAYWRRLLAIHALPAEQGQFFNDTPWPAPERYQQLDNCFARLWPALRLAIDRFEIPPRLLNEIVCGVAMDANHQHPANWEELRYYCRRVASAVGLACVHIWRAQADVPERSAVACGIAFQLTNILRDIAEDAGMGRIYIPLSELRRHGVDQASWLAGVPTGDWQQLIDHVAAETFELYAVGWHTIDALTPNSRRMFSLMWHSYHQLLQTIVRRKAGLWDGNKIHLPTVTRLRLLTTHLIPSILVPLRPTPSAA